MNDPIFHRQQEMPVGRLSNIFGFSARFAPWDLSSSAGRVSAARATSNQAANPNQSQNPNMPESEPGRSRAKFRGQVP